MFLLGMDYLTGRDYGHHKAWVIIWLKLLADVENHACLELELVIGQ
jgi:hypothetical protein|tara:strand:+ start:249 stop:386 length:138 start_codon:yes stop_codon:yes gene_type:complete